MGNVEWPTWVKDNTKWTHVSDPDECFAALHEFLQRDKTRISYLQEENERLKSETYKDEELQRMKKERDEAVDSCQRGFPISESEDEAIEEWIRRHMDEKHSYIDSDGKRRHKGSGAIGGRFTYKFFPTSIGTIGTIKCSCGEEFCFQELG